MISRGPDLEDRVLRDHAAIVFHLYVELVVRQDPLTEFQDFGERARVQPMIDVLTDMGLEHDCFALSDQSSAIDEVFNDVTDFGDVRVSRDGIAIGQNKMRERVRMLFENGAEIGELHIASIFLYRNIVKRLSVVRTTLAGRRSAASLP